MSNAGLKIDKRDVHKAEDLENLKDLIIFLMMMDTFLIVQKVIRTAV